SGALESLDAFALFLRQAEISVANLPAPFWHAWVREMAETGGRPPQSLRLLVTGSDRVHVEAAQAWASLAPACRWLSGYGPSETTITAALFDPAAEPLSNTMTTVPLGRPIANMDIHIVD